MCTGDVSTYLFVYEVPHVYACIQCCEAMYKPKTWADSVT
jgi:hypothetical protein